VSQGSLSESPRIAAARVRRSAPIVPNFDSHDTLRPHLRRQSTGPRLAVGLWLIATAVFAALAAGRGPGPTDGEFEGLVPPADRSRPECVWVILRSAGSGSVDVEKDTEALVAAADRVRAALGEAWAPLAPPAGEASGWSEEHLLHLIPLESHAVLAGKLTPEAIEAVVIGIRGRLSSPLFVASGEEPRRDPLGLRSLLGERAAALGLHAAAEHDRDVAVATAAGDLLAGDGASLLMQVNTREAPSVLAARVRAATGEDGLDVAVIGPGARRAAASEVVSRGLRRLPVVALAGLVIVLALGLRSVRPVLGQILCLLTGLALALGLGGATDLVGLPLVVLALGFGCEGMLHLQRIAVHGWAAPLLLASALVPALLAPYPAWQAWAPLWAGIAGAIFAATRFALPAALAAVGARVEPGGKGLSLQPWPIVSVLMASCLFGGGALALTQLRVQGPAPVAVGDVALAHDEAAARASFFDPDAVLTVESRGESAEEALVAAAVAAGRAAAAPAGAVRRFDLPGAFVVPPEELERRDRGLRDLAVPERIADLQALLRAAGLRPSAFGELLRGARDLDHPPSAEAALAGPLRPWLAAHVREGEGEAVVTSRLFVDGDADVAAIEGDGALELRGPKAAADRERAAFDDRLGLCVAVQLWLGALVIWLATRSFAGALSAALTALAGLCGVLGGLWLLGRPIGPALLPAFLLVGAAGLIAGGRACRAIDAREPLLVRGLLVTSSCQVAAGLALMSGEVPLWRQIGEVVTIGAALAPVLAVFATPGLYAMFRRLAREGGGGADGR